MTLSQAISLIRFKAWAELRAERERTYLGFVWWVLEPLMFMAIFYVVFGLVRGKGGVDFVAFLLVGLVTWQWFRACMSHAGASVLIGLGLMRQIRLPPVLFPLIVVVTDSIKFLVILLLLLLALVLLGHAPGFWILALPLVLAVQLLFILACAVPYAALVPFIPDLRHVVDTLLMGMMFLCGIFYSIETLSEPYRTWIHLNPMASLIQDTRRILLQNVAPDWAALACIAATSVLILAASVLLLRALEPRYTKLPK